MGFCEPERCSRDYSASCYMIQKGLSVTASWPQVGMDHTWPIRVPRARVQGGRIT